MAASFKAQDGQIVSDGDVVTLTLRKGDSEIEQTGTVRRFDHVERVYDEEGIAIGKTSEERWEISTDDPQHPAVGFLLENVLTRSGS